MKKTSFRILILSLILVGSCKQENLVTTPLPTVDPPVEPTPNAGGLVFTKFVAIGDSYVAGMQGGALFNAGQGNAIPKLMSTSFASVGGGAFNQPDINHENGFNASFSVVPGTIRGRMILFDPDGAVDPDGAGCGVSRSAAPRATGDYGGVTTSTCPSTVSTPNMPPPYNTAQSPLDPSFPFAGVKADLNNFGVPGARIFHAGIPNYGTLNPMYGRFASDPAAKPMITDAAEKGGNFFLFYFGNFDILNYATTGGVGSTGGTGTNDLTDLGTFTAAYGPTLNGMLAVPNSRGVVGNIPDITSLPYFTTVLWNQIEFKSSNCSDAATILGLNGLFGGYNAALDGLALAGLITPTEAAARKVVYGYGKNPVVISDETLTDLTVQLTGISPALAQFGKARPATSGDLITLAAGGALGTCAPGPPAGVPAANWVYGVSAPLPDQFVLIPTEISLILTRTAEFNDAIQDAVDAVNAVEDRLALADINMAYKQLMTNKAYVANGVTITPSFAPPTGAFSEDGIHPNSRGCAFTANVFLSAIEAKFGAVLPKAKFTDYPGTSLPVPGM